jgi:hypothetical protein
VAGTPVRDHPCLRPWPALQAATCTPPWPVALLTPCHCQSSGSTIGQPILRKQIIGPARPLPLAGAPSSGSNIRWPCLLLFVALLVTRHSSSSLEGTLYPCTIDLNVLHPFAICCCPCTIHLNVLLHRLKVVVMMNPHDEKDSEEHDFFGGGHGYRLSEYTSIWTSILRHLHSSSILSRSP